MKSTAAVIGYDLFIIWIRLCDAHGHVLNERLVAHDTTCFLIVVHGPFLPLSIKFLWGQIPMLAINRRVLRNRPQQDLLRTSGVEPCAHQRGVIFGSVPWVDERGV